MPRSFTSAFKLRLSPRWAGDSFTVQRAVDAGVAVLLVVGLGLPAAGSLLSPGETLKAENRTAAPPPQTRKFFRTEFDAYYADRTGGRSELLELRNRILLGSFAESPTPRVIVGQDGWLYFNTGFDPFDPRRDQRYDLDAVAKALAARAAWCRERGIVYVVQVAREKNQVSPEHLPERFRKRPAHDAVPELQAACPEAIILDTRPLLQRAAAAEPVYYRKDTHWNTRGAMLAYRQVAEVLEKRVPGYVGKPVAAFHPTPSRKDVSDLALLLGWSGDALGEETLWHHQPPESIVDVSTADLELATDSIRLKHLPAQCRRSSNRNGIHLLILHDSFGSTFRDYFASDVERLTALGTYGWPADWIEKEKPTVIVQQFVERAMMASSLAIK